MICRLDSSETKKYCIIRSKRWTVEIAQLVERLLSMHETGFDPQDGIIW